MTEEWAKAIRKISKMSDQQKEDLARKFEIATTTVFKWVRGTATPHRNIQKQILRELE